MKKLFKISKYLKFLGAMDFFNKGNYKIKISLEIKGFLLG